MKKIKADMGKHTGKHTPNREFIAKLIDILMNSFRVQSSSSEGEKFRLMLSLKMYLLIFW